MIPRLILFDLVTRMVPDGVPPCPTHRLLCEVHARDGLSDKGSYQFWASCYGNRAEGNHSHTLGSGSQCRSHFLFRTAWARAECRLDPTLLGPKSDDAVVEFAFRWACFVGR